MSTNRETQRYAVATTLLATDQQRSVLGAVSATQTHPLSYTPYGHRTPESGLLSLLGFNGQQSDPLTGHYLLGNGYRGFNPVLMRFNSPDSLSPFGEGGLNPYAYCVGDPVNRVDPTGHIPLLSRIIRIFSRTSKANNTLNTDDILLGYHGSRKPTNLKKTGFFRKGEVYVTSSFDNALKYAESNGTIFAAYTKESNLSSLSARHAPKTNAASHVSEMPINIHEKKLIRAIPASESHGDVKLDDIFRKFGRSNEEYHQEILNQLKTRLELKNTNWGRFKKRFNRIRSNH